MPTVFHTTVNKNISYFHASQISFFPPSNICLKFPYTPNFFLLILIMQTWSQVCFLKYRYNLIYVKHTFLHAWKRSQVASLSDLAFILTSSEKLFLNTLWQISSFRSELILTKLMRLTHLPECHLRWYIKWEWMLQVLGHLLLSLCRRKLHRQDLFKRLMHLLALVLKLCLPFC